MNVYDMLRYVQIRFLVALIENDKEEIETTHDGCAHSDISSQSLFAVVSSTDGIGSSKDRCPRVERCMDTSFGNGYRLLFHGFVDGNLV